MSIREKGEARKGLPTHNRKQIIEKTKELEKFQNIKSDIFFDRILEREDRLRFFYLTEIELKKIRIEQKIVVRELDQSLLNRLKPQIKSEGLIEPLTVEDLGNGEFLLLAGQHRYHVCKDLEIEKVPAKVHMKLDLAERLTLGYMSNEARKDPPAGRKYGALHEIFNETQQKLKNDLGREPAEAEVINQMYMAKNPKIAKVKTKEIILGMLVNELSNDSNCLVQRHQFISLRQVPKSRITKMIQNRHEEEYNAFPLLTSKNAFYGLSHLVRTAGITHDEVETGKDFKHNQRKNVQVFFDLLITKYIKPWMEEDPTQVDAAMSICRRHIFEILCKLIAIKLRNNGFEIKNKEGTKAPLYSNKKVPWSTIFDEIKPFFTPEFLTHPNVEQERSLDVLWNRVEYYVVVRPGMLPPF